MEEERIITGTQLFFCKTTDLGTGKEEWTEVKHVDSICLREKTTFPEVEVKEPWSTSFSLSASVEPTPAITNFWHNSWKRESGYRYYRKKLLRHISKKTLRKYCYYLKKYKSFIK